MKQLAVVTNREVVALSTARRFWWLPLDNVCWCICLVAPPFVPNGLTSTNPTLRLFVLLCIPSNTASLQWDNTAALWPGNGFRPTPPSAATSYFVWTVRCVRSNKLWLDVSCVRSWLLAWIHPIIYDWPPQLIIVYCHSFYWKIRGYLVKSIHVFKYYHGNNGDHQSSWNYDNGQQQCQRLAWCKTWCSVRSVCVFCCK